LCSAGTSTCKKCTRIGHFEQHCFKGWKPPPESRQVTNDFTSLMPEESEFHQYSDSESDTTAFFSTAGSRQ
jgi:hypothetical protein